VQKTRQKTTVRCYVQARYNSNDNNIITTDAANHYTAAAKADRRARATLRQVLRTAAANYCHVREILCVGPPKMIAINWYKHLKSRHSEVRHSAKVQILINGFPIFHGPK